MKRTLKRGESWKRPADQAVFVHALDGKVSMSLAGKSFPLTSAEIEIDEAEFKHDPTRWVPTQAEIDAVRDARVEKEKAYWKKLGKPVPDKVLATFGRAPENKELPGSEERREEKRSRAMATKG